MDKPPALLTDSNLAALISILRAAQLSLADWQTEKMNFIPLRGGWLADCEADFDLEEEISKFLAPQNNKKAMLLLGDSGAGKSLYTQGLVNKLWQNFSAQSPVPIWISLPSLKHPLKKAIYETFRKYGFNTAQIKEIRKLRSFIFVLDAYDEIHCEKNLYQTNHLYKWNAKVIITCRREYLYHKDNYKLFFAPFIEDKIQYTQYEEIYIRPFNANQIQAYVQQYSKSQAVNWKEPEKYSKAIDEIPGLKELIKTPFMLKLTMEVLPQIVEKYANQNIQERKRVTQAAIYDIFIEQWFIRQEKKLKEAKQIKDDEDIKPEFWRYAKELSLEMHKANVTQIIYNPNEESDLFTTNVKETPWDNFFTSNNPRNQLLRTACLIRETSQYHYAFIHASLIEYFLTRKLYENLASSSQQSKKQQLIISEPTLTSSQNINESTANKSTSQLKTISSNSSKEDYFNQKLIINERSTLQFLADRVDGQTGFKDSLLERVYASKNIPEMKIAAANAITILNLARVIFTDMDLSGVQIADADLSYGIFDFTNFNQADLTRVSFQSAWLRNADFKNANMQDVNLGMRPPVSHLGYVMQMHCSSDERWLIIRGAKNAYIHSISTGELLHTLEGHTGELRDFAVSHDEKYLATISADKIIRVWDINTGNSIHLLSDHQSYVAGVAFHPISKNILASCSHDKSIRIWDVLPGKCIKVLEPSVGVIKCIQFSPDGKTLVTGSLTGEILFWDVASWTLKKKYKNHNDIVTQLVFSSNGQMLASSSYDKTVRLWDVDTAIEKLVLTHKSLPIKLAFSPDGNFLITTDDSISQSTVTIWETHSGEIYHTLNKNVEEEATNVSFNLDGTLVAISCKNGVIHVLDISTKQEVIIFKDISEVKCVIFSPLGKYLISAGSSKLIKFWDINSRQKQRQYNVGELTSLNINTDGTLLAYGNQNGTACLMDLSSKIIWRTFHGHSQKVTGVAISPDSKFLATSCWDGLVRVWDIEKNQLLKTLPMLSYCIAFSKDGKLLSSGGAEGMNIGLIKIWHVGTWHEHKNIKFKGFVNGIDFSPDNLLLASGGNVQSDKGLTAWIRDINLDNNQEGRGLPGCWGSVQSVKFSHDGKILAVCVNKIVALYDIANAKFLPSLKGHVEAVMSVAFSPDGKLVAAGSVDNTVHIWDLVTQKCLIVIISQTGNISCVIWKDNHSVISGNTAGDLNCWKIISENDKYSYRLLWSIQDSLYAENCILDSIKNLSEINTKLLRQLQAGSKPSSLTVHPAFSLAKNVNEEIVQTQAKTKNINTVIATSKGTDTDISTLASSILQKVSTDRASQLCDYAATAFQKKNLDEARKLYDEAIQLDSKYARAYESRGYLYYSQTNYEKAIDDYDQAIKFNPNNAETYNKRGLVYAATRKHDLAFKEYEIAIKLDPKKAVTFYNRGDLQYHLKHYEEAIKDYDEAIKLNSKMSVYVRDLARAKYNLKNYQAALEDFDKAITLNPKDATSFYWRSFVKKALKQNESAIADLTCAINLNPNNASYFEERGDIEFLLKHYENAMNDYQAAIKLNPKNAVYYNSCSIAKAYLNWYEESILDLNQAIKLEPTNSIYYGYRGFMQAALGNHQDALNDYDASLKLNPNNSWVLGSKAISLLSSSSYADAEKLFNQVLSVTQSDEEIKRLHCYAHIGLMCINWINSREKSLKIAFLQEKYNSLISPSSKVYLSCNILAEFYLQLVKKEVNQNDYNKLNLAREEILKIIAQASKENTDLDKVYYYEAQLLLLSGETKLAKEKLQLSLQINPKFIVSQRLIENCNQIKPIFEQINDQPSSALPSDVIVKPGQVPLIKSSAVLAKNMGIYSHSSNEVAATVDGSKSAQQTHSNTTIINKAPGRVLPPVPKATPKK